MKLSQQKFKEVIELIQKSRVSINRAVNKELIELYWSIGELISERIKNGSWGNSIVDELSEEILSSQGNIRGFSPRNLWRMKSFYETYTDNEKLTPLVSQISWSNNLLILSGTKSIEEKEFYLRLCIKERYSKRELNRQINSGYFERTVLPESKLTPLVSEFKSGVTDRFRDSYMLEFLRLPKNYKENDLRHALLKNLKDFILELGKDFTFINQEYQVQVGNSDFRIDLLFYHRELQSLVAFELKVGKFKPEYVGQLNFYLEALDRDVKKKHENPSIGVLLCSSKDDQVVEYAMSRNISPTLVADYQTKLIDKRLLQQKMEEILELNQVDNGN